MNDPINWEEALDLARQKEPRRNIKNQRRVDGHVAIPTQYDREDLRKLATGEWESK